MADLESNGRKQYPDNISRDHVRREYGIALGCIVDGCPPGLEITENWTFKKIWTVVATWYFSLYNGSPWSRWSKDFIRCIWKAKLQVLLLVYWLKCEYLLYKDYSEIKDKFRPGHADYTYHQKYGVRDYRGGGRSSARETQCVFKLWCDCKKIPKTNLVLKSSLPFSNGRYLN